MNITAWKPISLCAALIFDKRRRKKGEGRPNVVEPAQLRRMQERKVQEAMEEASEQGSLHKSRMLATEDLPPPLQRSRSLARLNAQRDFLKATAQVAGVILQAEQDIPALEEAYAGFRAMYPMFQATEAVGELRDREYGHMDGKGKACLDYCGFGLFSYLQQAQQWESCAFALCPIPANLSSHAARGGAGEGTAEGDIRGRIMEYLNIPASEYTMVFTASRGSAFRLLAESYPFGQNRRMLSMYDYESQSVNWMGQTAREKGAQVLSAWFGWPTLRVCSSNLRKRLKQRKGRRKDPAAGLFVFPVQSRVTGAKYSYQWMSMAQRCGWHVLLDAGALGPKDMDSLGLSLFRPDFIIASFYKIFGLDPTGFGCLFIKNSAMAALENQGGAPGVGIVRIVPALPRYASDSGGSSEEDENGSERSSGAAGGGGGGEDGEFRPVGFDGEIRPLGFQLTAFSGPFSSLQVSETLEEEAEYSSARDGASPGFEDMEEDASPGEGVKSPNFSEDETDNSMFCIDLGQGPLASRHLGRLLDARSMGKSNLGQAQPPDEFSRRRSHGQLLAASANRGGEQGSGVMAFDSYGSDGGGRGRHSLFKQAEADPPSLDQSTDVKKTPEVWQLDPGVTAKVEEEVQTDPNCPGTNVMNGILHGSSGGSILLSASSRRQGSRRIPKLNKITFMLENQDPVSKGNAEAGRNIGHADEPSEFPIREVSRSPCFEITSCNEDAEQYAPSAAAEHGCIANGILENGSAEPRNYRLVVGSKQTLVGDGGPKLCKARESAIRREPEGELMLLGRREAGKLLSLEEVERIGGGRRKSLSFSMEGDVDRESHFLESGEGSGVAGHRDEETISDSEGAEEQEWTRRQPRIVCRHLDHVDSMGLNKTASRLRYLTNWLVSALLQLRHPAPNGGIALVHIYGPKIRYDRGGAVAFNLYDCNGVLVSPELVQSRAEEDNIALGLAFLSHILTENNAKLLEGKSPSIRVAVVTASLGFLSNFEDIYRLWAFVAKFLDEDLVKAGGCQSESGSSQEESKVPQIQ